jgi:PAS domain S-box-containing protein
MATLPEPAVRPPVSRDGLPCWPRGPFGKELIVQLLFWAAYLLLDHASTVFRVWPGTPAWYLPSGLALAILLAGGMRYAPVFLVAAATADLVGYHRPVFSWAGLPGTVAGTLCFVAGAAWLRSVWRFDLRLRRLRDVRGLILFLVVGISPAAALGVLAAWGDGRVTGREFPRALFNWWASDSISITSFAPFLLLYIAPKVGSFLEGPKPVATSEDGTARGLTLSEVLQLVAEFASIPLVIWLVFGLRQAVPYHPLYVLFFPLIWIALRHGLSGASLGVFGVNLGVIVAAHLTHPTAEGLPERQVVMLALALTGLCLGAVVSERREAEAALDAKSAELDSFFSVTPDLLCIASTDGYFMRLNPAWEKTLGYSRDELVAKGFLEFIHPEDVEVTQDALARLASQHSVLGFVNRYRSKGGAYRSLEWVSIPAGRLIYAAARDVTDQRKAEDALRHRERELREAQRLAHVGSWEWDVSRKIATWSEELCRITGCDPSLPAPNEEELQRMYPGEGWKRVRNAMQNALRSGVSYSIELERTYPGGTKQWIITRGEAVRTSSGKVARLRGTVQEITERKQAELVLQASEERYRAFIANSSEGIWRVELERPISIQLPVDDQIERIVQLAYVAECNDVMARIHGLDRAENMIGVRVKDMPGGDPRHIDNLRAFIRSGYQIEDAETFRVDVEGKKHYILSTYFGVVENGHLVRGWGVQRDITDRKRAEQSLRESEERFRATFDNAGIGMALVDMQGHPLKSNPALQRMLGYNEQELSNMVFTEFTHADDRARDLSLYNELAAGKRDSYEIEKRYIRKDGQVIWGHLTVSLVRGVTGRPEYAVGMVEDITQRKQATEELQRSFSQLRALAARLESIREEERKRVAREIHDGLGQALTAIKIDLSSLTSDFTEDDRERAQKAASIMKLADETIQLVRRISTELRPGILDDLGLVAAVEWAAEDFEARTGTKCLLKLPPEDVVTDPAHATAIFRILQETLTNVARHANASRVDVRLAEQNGDLCLEVRDNGKGISEAQLTSSGSLGILGMRERATLLKGELIIRGAPGQGTTVRARIPKTCRT